jgi:DNA-binding NtrC family response regulator
MSRSILLVDDDVPLVTSLARFLDRRGWQVAAAHDGRTGIELYERDAPDLVLTDLEMPGLTGLQVVDVLRSRDPDAVVLLLTGHGDIAIAVEALKLGAENFLTKPIDLAHLEVALERAYEKALLLRRTARAEARGDLPPELAALGSSPAMRRLGGQIELLAAGTAPVLLTGETGTGKGWLAKLLHARSPRAAGPFVEVNCAGLSATFLDSELFGHEKGAFTDAKHAKRGLFELADGGTLFLDEIGDLAPELQPKLLKVLESQTFRRLGGTRELTVDVRLVAATHVDLRDAVRARRFREDLYYRLAVLPLHLPPLRERGRDALLALTRHVMTELQHQRGHGPTTFSTEALALLLGHPWPGNIRELRNAIERVLLVAGDEGEIGTEHLPPDLRRSVAGDALLAATEPADGDLSLAAAERRHIARVLARVGGNRVHAARALGIARATLYTKLRET